MLAALAARRGARDLITVLVIGGYGGFGARLSRRLAGDGYDVVVMGRSAARAQAFAATIGARGVAGDRRAIAEVLARETPNLVVDAAGPFQGADHSVPQAAIAAGVPYLDLADGRAFVGGIGALDEHARAAGVAVISGASSVPALSGAVTRHLSAGLSRVEHVEIAISASNRASAGESVARAILSYVGQPLRLWRGQNWQSAFGWEEMHRCDFPLGRNHGLLGRWVALADVPDLDIAPQRLPGSPATIFHAGTELKLQMLALWLASWLVRWRLLRSLLPAARSLMPLYRAMLRFGGDRSAMRVSVTGWSGDRPVERRWVLVADRGDGPEIPLLAAQLLSRKILDGKVAPGARDAWDALDLDEFTPLFAALAIRHEVSEVALPLSLYRGVIGSAYATLPSMVAEMHDFVRDAGAEGDALVERGRHPLAKLAGWLLRFPPAGHWPLHVAFSANDGRERWTRNFGGHRFTSELSQNRGRLVERFGPLRCAFDLPISPEGLAMRLRAWSAFGVPLPGWLAPRIAAREWQDEGWFQFEVDIALPLVGRIVRYRGRLRRLPGEGGAT